MVATNCPVQPYYLQTDPAWKDETVGGSKEPLSDVGCTVCCVSMAFSQLGTATDPKILNAELKSQNGYTRLGLLKWDVAATASKGAIVFDLPRRPSHATIDAAIQSGNPVIAKLLLWESIPHWVLIVGKEGDEYLVKNPLCQERTVQKLSTLSKTIQSIRIVKRK
jgi:ABC-type bacteriocin/lantibiotic exporter with double-glycine peptidase domain